MLFKDFNLVEGFVTDWMHGVCLGLVKNLLALWFNGEHKTKDFYIGNKVSHCLHCDSVMHVQLDKALKLYPFYNFKHVCLVTIINLK